MRIAIILLLLIAAFACNKTVDLPDFEEARWKQDSNGCNHLRIGMVEQLKKVKDQLKGLTEEEMVLVLGKPDKHELYKRNQKFFIYEIQNAPACPDQQEGPHSFLSIRFNATGRAREVMIYQD